MVSTFLPATSPTVVTQDRTGLLSTWTVHAPHTATPHAYLVPVSPSSSRSTQRSGTSSRTSTFRVTPLTSNVITMPPSPEREARRELGTRPEQLVHRAERQHEAPLGVEDEGARVD